MFKIGELPIELLSMALLRIESENNMVNQITRTVRLGKYISYGLYPIYIKLNCLSILKLILTLIVYC
jgi:hypothetical protein